MVGQTSCSSTERRQAQKFFTWLSVPYLRLGTIQCQSQRSCPHVLSFRGCNPSEGGVGGKAIIPLSPCSSLRYYLYVQGGERCSRERQRMLCTQKCEGVTLGCSLAVFDAPSPAHSYTSRTELLSVISQSTFLSSPINQTTILM